METEQAIREKAIRLLARREYSARELATKLGTQFDPELVDQILASLAEQGLQSDQRFADGLVRGRINQGHGPIRIQAELKQKGIEPSLIQHVMESNAVDWFEQALSTYQRRFGTHHATDMKVRAKQMRFLQYRGFSMDQIRFALDFDPAEP